MTMTTDAETGRLRFPAGRLALLGLSLVALAAAAQMPGGQPPAAPGGPERQGQERAGAPVAARSLLRQPDPVIALERELPSLRTDLALSAAQEAFWGPFERSLRDAAEAHAPAHEEAPRAPSRRCAGAERPRGSSRRSPTTSACAPTRWPTRPPA